LGLFTQKRNAVSYLSILDSVGEPGNVTLESKKECHHAEETEKRNMTQQDQSINNQSLIPPLQHATYALVKVELG
jgi:hypothetical protein